MPFAKEDKILTKN